MYIATIENKEAHIFNSFKNKGNLVSFNADCCTFKDKTTIYYTQEHSEVKNVNLEIKKDKKLFFTTNTYLMHIKCNKRDDVYIIIESNELNKARETVSFINDRLAEISKQGKSTRLKQIKKVSTTSNEEISRNIDDYVDYKTSQLTTKKVCLYAEGGKAYHTFENCHEIWSERMQESFLGWKVLTSNEAKEMGLYKCGFCKKREKDPTESVDDFIERMNSEKEEY